MLEKFFDSFDPENPPRIAFYPVDKEKDNTEKRLANLLFSFNSYQRIDSLLKDSPIEEFIKKGHAPTMNLDYYEEMYYILMDIPSKDYKKLKYDDEELTYNRVHEMFEFLINFFIEYEEYEKCSDLQKVVKILPPPLTDI